MPSHKCVKPCIGVALVSMLLTLPGIAAAGFRGGGRGGTYQVSVSTIHRAGGAVGRGQAGSPVRYIYTVSQASYCTLAGGAGCVTRDDPCPPRNNAPGDDFKFSEIYRARPGTPPDSLGWTHVAPPRAVRVGAGQNAGECLNYKVIDPGPSLADVKAAVQKRLPIPDWQYRPSRRPALVNFPTLVFVTTPREPAVAPFPLGGKQVRVRVHGVGYTWTWGDGGSASFDGPGMPLDRAHPCDDRGCPAGYDFHVYARTSYDRAGGGYEVHPHVAWQVQYQIVGEPNWTPIPGDMFTDGAPRGIRVHSAHAVLVQGH